MKAVMIGLVACMGLSACETMQGAGRDIQKAGQSIEKSAD